VIKIVSDQIVQITPQP